MYGPSSDNLCLLQKGWALHHWLHPALMSPLLNAWAQQEGLALSSCPHDPACQCSRKIKCISLPCKPDNHRAFLEAFPSRTSFTIRGKKDRCSPHLATKSWLLTMSLMQQTVSRHALHTLVSKTVTSMHVTKKNCHCWKRATFPTYIWPSHRDRTFHVRGNVATHKGQGKVKSTWHMSRTASDLNSFQTISMEQALHNLAKSMVFSSKR